MSSLKPTPLPKAPLVVSAGVALVIATAAFACGDDTGTGGTGGAGGDQTSGGAPPGISGGGPSDGGESPGAGAPQGGAGGTENPGGAPGQAGGAGQ